MQYDYSPSSFFASSDAMGAIVMEEIINNKLPWTVQFTPNFAHAPYIMSRSYHVICHNVRTLVHTYFSEVEKGLKID